MLVVMVFWAGNFIVVKGAIGILPPIGFTFLRYSIATITLLILLRWREGAIRLPRGDVVPILVLGVIGFGCYQILWPVALQTIPAGDSALLIAATPVMTALLAMAVGADTPNAVKLIGAFVSFAGVALVIAAGQGVNLTTSLVGDGLTLIAAGCWAVYTVFGAQDPASPLAVGDHDVGDRGRDASSWRRSGSPSWCPRTCPAVSRTSGRPCSWPSCIPGRLPLGSPTSSSSTA